MKDKTKGSKVYLTTISILFMFFASLFIMSMMKPIQYQQKCKINNIIQKTSITYSADALPDGMKSDKGAIFSKVQKNMKVHITSTVNSEKPVSITGEINVYYDLIAEGLWVQSTLISNKKKLDLKDSNNTIIDSDFQINLEDIKKRIDKAEKDIVGTSPGKYIIKIRPDFQANILYESRSIPMDNTYSLSFEYSNGILKLTGENKEFVKNTPIENSTVIVNKLSLVGISLPIILSRYIFSITASILLILLFISLIGFKLITRKNTLSINFIDKKIGSRLITLQCQPTLENKILLPLSDFKELIKLADEKELNILKFNKTDSDIVVYVVIDGECIFNYTIGGKGDAVNNTNNCSQGSDMLNG